MFFRRFFCTFAISLFCIAISAPVLAQEIDESEPSDATTLSIAPTADSAPVLDHDDNAQMFVPAAMPVLETTENVEPEASEQILEEADASQATPTDEMSYFSSTEMVSSLPNPTYELEYIRVVGNTQHSKAHILRLMDVQEGKELTVEQLEAARLKLMISGLFNTVELHIFPGSESKKLELELVVDERSPFQINRYFIGTSQKSPFWMGLDVSWLAPFASSHRFRMAFAATSTNDYGLHLSYMIPSIHHVPVSIILTLQSTQGHEGIYDKVVPTPETSPTFSYLSDMDYEKHGVNIGIGYSILPKLQVGLRLEYMHLLRHNDDARLNPFLDSYLQPGRSHLTAFSANILYDSRQGRIMPNAGHMVALNLKGTAQTAASQYQYIKASVAHQSNWSVAPQHVLRLNTFGGFVFGKAPFFEKFFFNDFYSLGTGRVLGINPSSRGAYDMFKTGTSGLGYEDFLVHLALSYAWQPKARKVELFFTADATWADSLDPPIMHIGVAPKSERSAFPIDLSLNAGARFKTNYGIFSLTIGHILDLAGGW